MILMCLGICGTPEWTKTSNLLSEMQAWCEKAEVLLDLDAIQSKASEVCPEPGCEDASLWKALIRSYEGYTNS